MSVKIKSEKPKMSSSYRIRMLTTTAMLGAFAAALMFIEFPLAFIAPPFYKLDFSEIPVMIGTFAFGPVQGIVIELIKIGVHLIIKGTATGFIGELANLIIGCTMILPAYLFYHFKRTKKSAVIGLGVSTLTMGIAGVLLNAFLLIPTYAAVFNIPVEVIVGMGNAIFPVVNDVFTLCLLCVLPFNLIKGVLVSAVVLLIYKPLANFLHKGRP